MRHLDLFSGIGGFALAASWVWPDHAPTFCEIDPYCRAVLRRHWPTATIHDDIRTLDASPYAGYDLITGGFPCQDLSHAGRRGGLDGERSGLWRELARVIGEVRPRYVVVENVANILAGERGRWFGRVLGDLAALGYDAEWDCIPACAVGAPHIRDRTWVVAYPASLDRTQPDGRPPRSAFEAFRRDHVAGLALAEHRASEAAARARGMAHDVPDRVDRNRGLGNAILPRIARDIFAALEP